MNLNNYGLPLWDRRLGSMNDNTTWLISGVYVVERLLAIDDVATTGQHVIVASMHESTH